MRQAYLCFAAAAKQGDSYARLQLAKGLLSNDPEKAEALAGLRDEPLTVDEARQKGVSALLELADKGDAEAEYLLAHMYRTGTYVALDGTKAREMLERSADKGYEPAVRTLAMIGHAP